MRMAFLGWLTLSCASMTAALAQETATAKVCGRLDTQDGHKTLYLWGSPEERGFAEGFLMADIILKTFDEYCLSERLFPNPQLWNVVAIPMVKMRVDASDALKQRANGLARGLSSALGDDAKSAKLGRSLNGDDFVAIAALIDWLGQFCSSFVAYGPMLAESEGPLVGRNLDYPGSPTMTQNTLIKVEAADPDRNACAWISFGWAGMLGCVTGFSEKGVTVAIHDVPAKAPKEGKVRPRVDVLAQLIETLEPGAGIAEEARLIADQHQYAMGGNFMLGWGRGEYRGGAVLEVGPQDGGPGKVSLRLSEKPFVVCTNHHRQRVEPIACNRFDKLCFPCDHILDDGEDSLDFESAWKLIGQASVGFTLYRTLIDIESGVVRFQHRIEPFGDWSEVRDFDARDLQEQCRAMSSELK